MKKILCLILGGLIIMTFIGCSLRLDELNKSTAAEEKSLNEVINKIADALDSKDSELLRSVLSENAKNSDDIDLGINYTLEFYKGKITEIKKEGCPVKEHIEYGKTKKLIDAAFILKTDEGNEYFLDFQYWMIQDFNPSEQGVNVLKISDNSIPNESYKSTSDYNRSGIFNPEWDNS